MLLPALAYLDNEPVSEDSLTQLNTIIEERKRQRRAEQAATNAHDDAIATQKRERLTPDNDVFQKIR